MRPADILCDCGEGHRPGRPFYYTSVQNDKGEYRLLSGPYENHPAARAALKLDRRWAVRFDIRAPWYRYGTAVSYHADLKTIRGKRHRPGDTEEAA